VVAAARDPQGVGERLVALREAELTAVLRSGTAQGLGTSLVASLQAAGLPVPNWLETHRFNEAMRRTRIMDTLGAIAPVLTDSGIPWVVLKGPTIARSTGSASLREFGDLDILVAGDRVADVLEIMSRLGIDAMNRNWGAYLEHGVAEFPVHALGSPIDLHWHVIGLGMVRERFAISTDELLRRRITGSVGGVEFPRLEAEDNVVHVALHAGLAGATRIGWLRDVHDLIEGRDLNWSRIIVRAHRFRAASIVGHVLDRCRCVLGTPVPAGIAERLTPSGALRLRRRVDAGTLLPLQSVGRSYSGFLVAISRAGTIETAGRAGELVRTHLESWVGRSPHWSAYEADGPLYWARPSGGPDGMQRYLEYAAQAT
jgi:hypothetical protein